MIVVMAADASAKEIADVIGKVKAKGYESHLTENGSGTIIGLVGEGPVALNADDYGEMAGVVRVERVPTQYKLASRAFHPPDSNVPLNGSLMGDSKVLVIATSAAP